MPISQYYAGNSLIDILFLDDYDLRLSFSYGEKTAILSLRVLVSVQAECWENLKKYQVLKGRF